MTKVYFDADKTVLSLGVKMAENYEGYEKIGTITATFGELTNWVLEMLENKGVMVTTGPGGFFEIEIGVYRKNNE